METKNRKSTSKPKKSVIKKNSNISSGYGYEKKNSNVSNGYGYDKK